MNKPDGLINKSPNLDDLARIDKICTQFEESCQAGNPMRIEKLLTGLQDQARQQALLELLLLDLDYHAPDDLEQAEVDYRRRFKSDWPVVATAMKKHRAYQSNGQPQKKKPAGPTPTEFKTQELADEQVTTGEIFASVSIPERIRYLNDYELLEEIARGGMGIVYRAKDRRLNRIVAIKMLLPGELASEDQIDRFLREARTAAKLRHPNIVTVYEVGLLDEVHYFAMDYIDGQDLEKFSREHSTSTARAVKYVVEAARAVHYAHSERVLHRDLKPANLLIDQDGEIHVTDFGLAKSIAVGETITKTGMVMGTPSYMPPEQAKGAKDKIGVESDVYGLGAVLFFLLTGRAPFAGDTPFEVISAVLNDPPPSLRSLNANVPKELEMICLKCLEKAPEDRYRSAAALANDLERWLSNEPIRAREVGLAGRAKLWLYRHWKQTLAAALIVVTVTLAFRAGQNSTTQPPHVGATDPAEVDRLEDEISALQARINDLEQESLILRDSINGLESEKKAIAAIVNLGGKVMIDPQFPNGSITGIDFTSAKIGDDDLVLLENFETLQTLILENTQVTDKGVELIERLTNLQSLDLSGTRVTSAGLENLKGLAQLKSLKLYRTSVGDAGLEHLKGLTKLELLSLTDTRITDAGLEHLKDLKNLQTLYIGGNELTDTGITDLGLEQIKGLTNLQSLCIHFTPVTDAGLEHLKGLTNLQYLCLKGNNVTDTGLEKLKGLISVERLNLNQTRVTDAGLEYLEGITNLKLLYLNETQVTDAGIQKLKEAFPKCTIRR